MFSRDLSIKLPLTFFMLSVLTACGGNAIEGPGIVPDPVIEDPAPDPVIEDPAPDLVIEEPDPIEDDPISSPLTYDVEVPVYDISSSSYQDPYVPGNAIDQDSESNESRWSGLGIDTWLQIDLGELNTVNTLNIDFLEASQRNSCFNIQTSLNGTDWTTQRANIVSNGETLFSFNETEARYIRYEGLGNSVSEWNSIIEIAVFLNTLNDDIDLSDGDSFDACPYPEGYNDGDNENDGEGEGESITESVTEQEGFVYGTGATFIAGNPNPSNSPDENFDMSIWKITYPDATETDPPEVRDNEFYTDPETGAMVFECVNQGERTSSSTKYSRSELREMLRPDSSIGTKDLGNNWVISEASSSIQEEAAGINGNMKATVAVDRVSTTYSGSDEFMLGRVIVGQIHGSENEPFKIFYRKLPGNSKGSIYFNYEDDDIELYYEFIGSRDNDAADPEDGIALGEKWAYEVDVQGRDMTVTVTRENGDFISRTITWDDQYDNDWFYFKAGNYNQNNGGEDGDHAKVSIFHLDVTHD